MQSAQWNDSKKNPVQATCQGSQARAQGASHAHKMVTSWRRSWKWWRVPDLVGTQMSLTSAGCSATYATASCNGNKTPRQDETRLRGDHRLEMCMGMGFPVGMGIPWDSRGNGNEKQISMRMGMISRGSGNVGKCFVKNWHWYQIQS